MQTIDVLWMLSATGLVFFMQAGFMCLESGLTRAKNSINVAIKNLVDIAISIFFYWAIGFGLMFGASYFGFFGLPQPFSPGDSALALSVFFLFQLVFCSTATTIVSGAVAERLRFSGYIVIAVIISGIVYPIFGHWAWAGLLEGDMMGILGKSGFIDFAGSTVVHSIGGWVALAAVLVIGARKGRFGKNSKVIQGNNLPLAVLGTIILWFGWIGFNGGSTFAFSSTVIKIIVNTMLAGSAGCLMALLISWYTHGFPKVEDLINGSLAGLVAITASCYAVGSHHALIIGIIGALVMHFASLLLEKYEIDDAIGAIPVHLGAGMWGTVAVGLFGDLAILNTGLSRGAQIGIQLVGITVCGLFAFGFTYVVLRCISSVFPLRVSSDAERKGLNYSEHHATTEIADLLSTMYSVAQKGDLSERALVEPNTQTGQISQIYNQSLDKLEHTFASLKSSEKKLLRSNKQYKNALARQKELERIKTEFLAVTSHELRTPLTPMRSQVEMIAGGLLGNISKEQKESLGLVLRCTDRLDELIQDMLDYSKLETNNLKFNLQPNNLYEMLADSVTLMKTKAEDKQIKLKIDAQKVPSTVFDDHRMRQVILNLLSNAIKFTSEGGSIAVSLKQKESHFEVSVTDTGIGLKKNEKDIIFEPFQQADSGENRKFEGTGLGLAIAKRIVEAHEGSIWVESEFGKGTTMTFTLKRGLTAGAA